jgi:tRNA threonylcarbamoyl adenosine modification protein YeaZ
MNLLAVDTSQAKGTLALNENQVEWHKQAMHSEVANVQLQAVLQQSRLEFKDLTHLAVNIGPGSFTGIRVGISLIRTLAYSLDLPVACLNSLEIMAYGNSKPGDRILVATRAIQNFYYAAVFERAGDLMTLQAPQSVQDPQTLGQKHSCTKVLLDGCTEARDLVRMLADPSLKRQFFSWQNVKPLYVRASEAEEKLKRGI